MTKAFETLQIFRKKTTTKTNGKQKQIFFLMFYMHNVTTCSSDEQILTNF